jgi:PTS system nitrogen regulatory IIA component
MLPAKTAAMTDILTIQFEKRAFLSMPSIAELLAPKQVHSNFNGHSRKKILQLVAESLAQDANDQESSADTIYESLMERERLGSTGLGDGVAIPHCRMDCEKILGAFVSLINAIDYEALDGEPVDLIFVLVVPKEEATAHLEALATLAQIFEAQDYRDRLRAASTDEALFQTMLSIESEITEQTNVTSVNSN